MEKWESSFKARTDLAAYDDTALGLFALQLRFSIDDIESVAADSRNISGSRLLFWCLPYFSVMHH